MYRRFGFFIMIVLAVMASSCGILSTDQDQVLEPIFDPPEGYYTLPVTVVLSCPTPGAEIRYNTDGTSLDTSYIIYTEPFRVEPGTTVKAAATKLNMKRSKIVYAAYFHPADLILSVVPGGVFNNGISNVTLSSFQCSRHEITQGEYQAVMGTNPASGVGEGGSYPVYNVSWFDAIEYCNRRSLLEGFEPVYSYGNLGSDPSNWPAGWKDLAANQSNINCDWGRSGYRLPTEMEWEFAARGGSQSHGYTYSGSNVLDRVAWYGANAAKRSHYVGTKLGNEIGLRDMSGNVSEWLWDLFGEYPEEDQNNPTGAATGSNRVHRGGSWTPGYNLLAVHHRDSSNPTSKKDDLGFRIVRRIQ
ncbi:MAG: SUMF1/EgtB/PvdO family nonheme iron enzyme [Candidatus Cloacimonadota bacterium]